MVSSTEASPPAPPHSSGFRWIQLAMGIVCMAMIANLQYGWTLFVDPIDAKYHWGRTAIQLAFTIFVVTETWLVPVEAWFVDKYGPRIVIMFGGVMIALAWVLRQPGVVAIPKSADPAHLRHNAGAAEIVLEEADLRSLDRVFPPPQRKQALEML